MRESRLRRRWGLGWVVGSPLGKRCPYTEKNSILHLRWRFSVHSGCHFYRATAYNATHGIAVAIPSVHLSVRPSFKRVSCDKSKWCTTDILRRHQTTITLIFWHRHSMVDDAPFPVKYSPKVIHPFEKRQLRQISAYNVSTARDSEKIHLWRIGNRAGLK